MRTIRWVPASIISLLPLAAAQDETELVVPSGAPAVVDGRIDPAEWEDAAPFALRRVDEALARVLVKRAGRQLYLAFETAHTPWALGVRFNFTDPVSQRSNPVLVTPLNPPRSPVTAYRQLSGREAEAVGCASCDLRFDLKEGCRFELRLPLDLLEITRTNKVYRLGVEMWDLAGNRTLAVYPHRTLGASGALATVALKPDTTWGADEPLDAPPPPVNPAIALLERMADPDGGELSFDAHTGWTDGKRRDAPLADLEKRLRERIAAQPDYVSLRALLVQVQTVRNDHAGALAALDTLGEAFPEMAESPSHLLIRTELLRDGGRFREALDFLAGHPEALENDPQIAASHRVLASLRDDWELELRMREADAKKGDLPRVRLETGRGPILLELFEDDAPNGVANFVTLVETGFYNGTRFHWVEGGRRALGGDPNSRDDDPDNDGFGDPGYLIEAEPGRRKNLPFTIAFADKRRSRRTEGSAFILHIAPLPVVDGMNTVFGRVIEGHDVVRRLEHDDTLERAVVVRKRPHAYAVVKRP